ncbi:hypothetical protein SAMN04489761_3040 [Tenacibaculum sp. MAR_2009_124]|uniref:hypothetical protein n=1 Tax=Tenacibaculum sp. MAR_2009_124 TaxID=1250059 RepID=UPI00089D4BA7|nr:hypothetical protein [Tenacibaculum sp. MAR_2009_124]SEC45527.1 hypothetical protein SAMN04489761_3040 [Tenacibaculum sp. MAR_2009_124]
MKTREERIEIVNKIINAISLIGRNFFRGESGTAYIFQKGNKLYMKNSYTGIDMCIITKYGYPPKGWTNGGTLWGLVKDFKEFIQKGGDTNHNNGYGGLYCTHWGYSEEEMYSIQNLAFELGYLKQEPKKQ